MPKIALIMGSDSDFDTLKPFFRCAGKLGLEVEARVISAHRTPDEAAAFAKQAASREVEVIVAAAGMAAHLGGVLAAHTELPVIGIPLKSAQLDGVDALYSTVMMPPGVPVASMGINAAENAALFAAQILALKYPAVREAFHMYRTMMAEKVRQKDEALQTKLRERQE